MYVLILTMDIMKESHNEILVTQKVILCMILSDTGNIINSHCIDVFHLRWYLCIIPKLGCHERVPKGYIGPTECDPVNDPVRYRGHTDIVLLHCSSHGYMSRLRIVLRLARKLVRMLT